MSRMFCADTKALDRKCLLELSNHDSLPEKASQGKVYLGSWFWGFQSMVGSHHYYGPEMRQDITVAGVCV